MLFCLYCGKALLPDAEKLRTGTMPVGGLCQNCGKIDPLSLKFCVHCGAEALQTTTSTNISHLSWDLRAEAGTTLVKSKKKSGAKQTLSMTTVLVGCALGGVLGALAAANMGESEIVKLLMSSSWKPGLVIYATPMIHERGKILNRLDVTLDLIPPESDKKAVSKYILSQLGAGADRASVNLPLPESAVRSYKVKINAPGCRAVELTPVTVEPGRPTVLGFPNPIELPVNLRQGRPGN